MSVDDPLSAIRSAILKETLVAIPFDGWTDRALAHGARAAGFDAGTARRAFPDGPRGLMAYFQRANDQAMLDAVDDHGLDEMRTRDRVATAIRVRLEHLAPHREAVRRGVGFLALPQNAGLALRCLHRTVDEIWRAAGDRSADFNYYSKRGLLAGVYGATLLVWLNDDTPGSARTWDFLDRRIDEVLRIGRLMGRSAGRLGRLPDPFRLLARFGTRRH